MMTKKKIMVMMKMKMMQKKGCAPHAHPWCLTLARHQGWWLPELQETEALLMFKYKRKLAKYKYVYIFKMVAPVSGNRGAPTPSPTTCLAGRHKITCISRTLCMQCNAYSEDSIKRRWAPFLQEDFPFGSHFDSMFPWKWQLP